MYKINSNSKFLAIAISSISIFVATEATASGKVKNSCKDLPAHSDLKNALKNVVTDGGNGGLNTDMWATVVNRDGVVCAVTFSGEDRGSQWPGSRVISAQKANTANAFSLPNGANGFPAPLSSGNLYGLVLEQGSLFGLQFSNPVNPKVAYAGPSKRYGQTNDPLVGKNQGV